jgi:hypothetical protein
MPKSRRTYIRSDDEAVMIEIRPYVYVEEELARALGLLRRQVSLPGEYSVRDVGSMPI